MTRWIAAAGAFVVSLDSMVNIAFPSMAAAFRLPPEAMRWVIICYVGTYALMSFGGGAPPFGWLRGGRVVQGVAAGLVYGTAPGLVTLAAPPEERGRALGFVSAG